jgi:release factor glutamine methyltransferase
MSRISEVSVGDFLHKFIDDLNGPARSTDHEKNQRLRDVRLLVAHLKKVSLEQVLFAPEDLYLTKNEQQTLYEMLSRYNNREPISKIIHQRFFWKHAFYVNENVLDPRPETELIIELILEHFAPHLPLRFLDMGTGSGCILLSLLQEYENAVGVGIDVSEDAITVARQNRDELATSISVRADFIAMDWNDLGKSDNTNCEKKPLGDGLFDVIVGNPPYIRSADIDLLPANVRNYDPAVALDGGPSGTVSFGEIACVTKKILNPGGKIFLEIGAGQSNAVKQILQREDLLFRDIRKDLNGIERVIIGEN